MVTTLRQQGMASHQFVVAFCEFVMRPVVASCRLGELLRKRGALEEAEMMRYLSDRTLRWLHDEVFERALGEGQRQLAVGWFARHSWRAPQHVPDAAS